MWNRSYIPYATRRVWVDASIPPRAHPSQTTTNGLTPTARTAHRGAACIPARLVSMPGMCQGADTASRHVTPHRTAENPRPDPDGRRRAKHGCGPHHAWLVGPHTLFTAGGLYCLDRGPRPSDILLSAPNVPTTRPIMTLTLIPFHMKRPHARIPRHSVRKTRRTADMTAAAVSPRQSRTDITHLHPPYIPTIPGP